MVGQVKRPITSKCQTVSRDKMFEANDRRLLDCVSDTHRATLGMSYPASIVVFPADTAAESSSRFFPVLFASATKDLLSA